MKYEIIRPWHGVKKGQVLEIAKLTPSLAPRVRALSEEAAAVLTTAVAPSDAQPNKQEVIAQLKEHGIQFDGRKSAEELAQLLPQ